MEKYNLVLIDDASPILNLSKKYFDEKFNVFTYDNAQSCLTDLKNNLINPHIIITDLTMPIMNGEDFIVELKQLDAYADLPLIVLSASDDSSVKIKMLKMGADDFIVKPFNFEELHLRINNIFKRMTIKH